MLRRSLIPAVLALLICAPLRADDPASLQIRVEEGEGQSYAVGSRATRGITVVVTDEAGNAVAGASVNFALPENGSSGVFSDGSKSELVLTKEDGRATVWGMRWNRQAGVADVRIVAGKGAARAGTTVSVQLVEGASGGVSVGGSSHKWLWIGLGAAAAAGAGIGIAMKGGGSSGSCSSTVVSSSNPCSSAPDPLGVTVIGVPTINIGHP